ncbi:MAG: hypothetical protein ACXVCP_03230 [Bdellovibrio sp.]
MNKKIALIFLALALSPIANAHELKIDVDDVQLLKLAKIWCDADYAPVSEQNCIDEVFKQTVEGKNTNALSIVYASCNAFSSSATNTSCKNNGVALLNEILTKNDSAIEKK